MGKKVAIVGTIWVLTIALTACVMTPILLSWMEPSVTGLVETLSALGRGG